MRRWQAGLLGALVVLLLPGLALAQTAGLLPNGEQQFIDGNGTPYLGGQVFFYIPNTTTPKTTWVDPNQSVANANPVVLDAAGRAVIYGSGQYRQVLKDQFGNTIWDQLTFANGTGAGTTSVKTGTYTVQTSDAGAFFALGGSAFYDLIFPAASGFPALFQVSVTDTDATRAKRLNFSSFDTPLWPGQTCVVTNVNSAWVTQACPSRYEAGAFPMLFVGPGGTDPGGSFANDCLASTSACATIQAAVNEAFQYWGLIGLSDVLIQLLDNGSPYAPVAISGGFSGQYTSAIVEVQGDCSTPSNTAIAGSPGVPAFYVRDNAYGAVRCLKIQGTSGAQGLNADQNAVIDTFDNVVFGAVGTGTLMVCENYGHIDVNASPLSITGSAAAVVSADHCDVSFSPSSVTFTNSPAFGTLFIGADSARLIVSTTFSGTVTCSGSYNLSNNAILQQNPGAQTYPCGSSVLATGAEDQINAFYTFGGATPSHLASTGTTPALVSCGGGSPAVVGSDTAGVITLGTSATGCTLVFAVQYNNVPACTVTWIGTNPLSTQNYTNTDSQILIAQTSTSGNKVAYNCIAPGGG